MMRPCADAYPKDMGGDIFAAYGPSQKSRRTLGLRADTSPLDLLRDVARAIRQSAIVRASIRAALCEAYGLFDLRGDCSGRDRDAISPSNRNERQKTIAVSALSNQGCACHGS